MKSNLEKQANISATENSQLDNIIDEIIADLAPIIHNLFSSAITISVGVGVHLLSMYIHSYIVSYFNLGNQANFIVGAAGATVIASNSLNDNKLIGTNDNNLVENFN